MGDGVGEGGGVCESGLGVTMGLGGGVQLGIVLVGKACAPLLALVPVFGVPLPNALFWLDALLMFANCALATVVATPKHEQSANTITSASTPLTAARNWRSVSQRCWND